MLSFLKRLLKVRQRSDCSLLFAALKSPELLRITGMFLVLTWCTIPNVLVLTNPHSSSTSSSPEVIIPTLASLSKPIDLLLLPVPPTLLHLHLDLFVSSRSLTSCCHFLPPLPTVQLRSLRDGMTKEWCLFVVVGSVSIRGELGRRHPSTTHPRKLRKGMYAAVEDEELSSQTGGELCLGTS
ncbi:hypothetical protein BKA64DRAFT_644476 [Cadophora sp. MPI-SDFR-AT-0126]|nr:hypothetical protein BKA64DRAFT_644476 [Leotiomycetes sp. MPI-SDFR-AT-0126]